MTRCYGYDKNMLTERDSYILNISLFVLFTNTVQSVTELRTRLESYNPDF